jgi:hypothetical protein
MNWQRGAPIFRRYGFDLETAVNAYLMQIATDISMLPHGREKTEYVRPPMQFDCLKGVLDIGDDFSDVIADFKEYI